MKRFIFLSLVSLLSLNYNQGVASGLFQEASEAVGNELVRLGKISCFSKEEKEIETTYSQEVRNRRTELEDRFTQGNLAFSEYAAQDEVIACELPIRNMKRDAEEMSENPLHSKIIILANRVLMGYLNLFDENSLDVTAKNTQNGLAFTVSNIEVKQNKEDESWGNYNLNNKVFSFTNLTSNRSVGKTSFSFEAKILGFDLSCEVTSSWRLYGKKTNLCIFSNGHISKPVDITYSPQN